MTTLENLLIGAVAVLCGALTAMWKIYTAREDKAHERSRNDRAEDRAELQATRKEFTSVLIELSGMQSGQEDEKNQ